MKLVPRGPSVLDRPTRRPGFGEGVASLLAGFVAIVGSPSLWPLALAPMAAAGAVTVAVGAIVLDLVFPALSRAFGGHVPYLQVAAEILVVLLVAPLALLAGLGVAQPIAGPALNRIVRRVEERLGAPSWPPSSVLEDVGRALQSIALAYGVGLPLLAILYGVTIVFPAAAVVTFPVKLVVLALMIAWDLCDYPLSIHGVPVGRRVAFMGRNLPAMLGFGFGLGLLSLVPGALLLVLPAGVAGATRLTRRIELFEDPSSA